MGRVIEKKASAPSPRPAPKSAPVYTYVCICNYMLCYMHVYEATVATLDNALF